MVEGEVGVVPEVERKEEEGENENYSGGNVSIRGKGKERVWCVMEICHGCSLLTNLLSPLIYASSPNIYRRLALPGCSAGSQ